ncbi:MAG: outer membrane protein transport protein [Alphaproteobacteria bacterium]|nr:outer membrane protein transport protein [Alphaproteobacteria bacterium]
MNFSTSSSSRIFAFVFSTGAFLAGQAHAAGFQLTDFSMTGLGRSYAGAGVVGDDYSAIAANPAGMTLKGTGGQAGAAVIWQHGRVKGFAEKAGAPGGTASGKETVSIPVAVPNLFAQYAINDDFRFGLGVYAPFGLATEYDDDWFGSDLAVDSELEVIDIAPSLAYRLNDSWSFGASLIARYGKLKMTNTSGGTGYSDFDIDGWGYYGRFGVMYEADENTRLGIVYQTKSTEVEHTLKGDHAMTGMPAPFTPLNGKWIGGTVTRLPEHWQVTGYRKIGDFGYSATVRRTHWQNFNEFTLTSTSLLGHHTSYYKWKNTWTAALGIDWYYNDTWTWRAGVAYDESPVPNAAARTVRITDNDRYWLSAGFTYKINENVKMDVGYAHLYLPTYKARNGASSTASGYSTKTVDAKYDINAEILGVQFQYDF